jgi:hypothetical protein
MRWLVFLPELSGGSSERVRVWRGLQRLGAVSLQNALWVLPDVPRAIEALRWFRHELSDQGSRGALGRLDWLEGHDDAALLKRFKDAAAEQWQALAREVAGAAPEQKAALARRFEELARRDWLGAPGRAEAERALQRLGRTPPAAGRGKGRLIARTWVTRRDIHVDRMASAWLIRRFIDPRARFRFVDLARYRPQHRDLRFDMDGGEFTHQGQRCTFEVLQHRFRPKDRALKRLGELVHDLDFGDGRFGRPETAGFGQQLDAIATAHAEDRARLERASALLDDLYAHGKGR